MTKILTEEELKFFEENALGTNYWNMTDALESVINSHRNLLSANAELSFENNKLKKLIFNLDAHIDFSFPPASGELMEFKDASGIAQVFKEAYRIVNPEQAAINEAMEELK